MRVFVGLPLDAETSASIYSIADALAERIAGVRWVPSSNLHITVHFLGDVEPTAIGSLVEEVNRAGREIKRFHASVSRVATFPPSGRQVRVVHLPLEDGAAECREIFERLAVPCSKFAAVDRREYNPHITLGRGTRGADGSIRRLLVETDVSVTFPLSTVTVFESRLSPSGARYVSLADIPLQ